MHLKTRNVNTAFRTLVSMFHTKEYQNEDGAWGRLAGAEAPIVSQPSRNGNTLMIDEPVTITYTRPKERVLFNAARDCNPFFHLYEALWMLAGRNDVAPLAYYNKRMAEFSDDGKTFNGAYGYRWRNHQTDIYNDAKGPDPLTVDQLDILITHLKADPTSRRAVLQMWNVEDDLLKIGQPNPRGEIGAYRIGDNVVPSDASKDVCCNLLVSFLIRKVELYPATEAEKKFGESIDHPTLVWTKEKGPRFKKCLDMTLYNRSNDTIWGLLGANYVHFTILQEYMAARLGCEVGVYHHFSNNLHVYDWNWKPEEWLSADRYEGSERQRNELYSEAFPGIRQTVPLVKDPEVFERELPLFVGAFNGEEDPWRCVPEWEEPFLMGVAAPLLSAFRQHKQGEHKWAMEWANEIKADDWRIAATQWLQRRVKK